MKQLAFFRDRRRREQGSAAPSVPMVSVGHKYTTKLPNHRGAPFAGRGWETDYAEKMLEMS